MHIIAKQKTRYYKTKYDWFLTKYFKRDITTVGSPSYNKSIISGFTASNYGRIPSTISVASNNITIIVKCTPSAFSKTSDLFGYSGANRPIGFRSGGYLGSYGAYSGSWKTGTNVYTTGKTYWVKVIETATQEDIYIIADNGYTLDTLPDISKWTLELSRTDINLNQVYGTFNIGNTYKTTSEYFQGSIDLSGCALYRDGVLIWKGVVNGTSSDSQWNETTKVFTGTDYTGEYTYNTAIGEIPSDVNDFDRSEDYFECHAPVGGGGKYPILQNGY